MRARSIVIVNLLAGVAACSSGGGGFNPNVNEPDLTGDQQPDLSERQINPSPDFRQTFESQPDLSEPFTSPPDFSQPFMAPPDFARATPPDMTAVPTPTAGVGEMCTKATMCTGPNPQCYTTIPGTSWSEPSGYCSNTPCMTSTDCGTNGACAIVAGTNLCLRSCTAGSCASAATTLRCFYLGSSGTGVCLPMNASMCDPTSAASCGGTGACIRQGFDNVGDCGTPCVFGSTTCPVVGGKQTNCIFLNERVNAQGAATSDTFAGLLCSNANASDAPGAACTYTNDCVAGYECDFFGTKTCKKLCRVGTSTDCPVPGTTCANEFKLTTFTTGSIGLCQ